MTSTGAASAATSFGPARLLAGVGEAPAHEHEPHRRTHGELVHHRHAELVDALARVGIRGRGGAGFPVATKLDGTPEGRSTEVVVNLSEGEPASRKDRALAELAPHLILDGALATAAALRTRRVTVAVHDVAAADMLARAAGARADAQHVVIRQTHGGFAGGEVRALLGALDGAAPVPPGRRTLPTVAGLAGNPTFASNAETFAHLGLLATHGAEWYAEVGSVAERGTTLLTLIGDVDHPGIVEAPLGLSLERLVGAGGPVLIGGYHGTWVDDVTGLDLDRTALSARGVHLGAGVIARLPGDTCSLGEVARVAGWLAGESAGQCGPCYFGLPAVADDLRALASGRLPGSGLEHLRGRLGLLPRRGACGHPDGAAMFVRTALDTHGAEIAQHLAHGSCGRHYTGVLPVTEGRR